MRISIIGGTGHQGKGLALRLGKAGYHILLGSRLVEKATATANEIKEKHPDIEIEGMDNFQAANSGDIIILTIPFKSVDEIMGELRNNVAHKVIIDTSVALIPGKPPTTAQIHDGSVAQRIQNIVGEGAPVVSAFHTISAHLLQDIDKELCGDTLVAGDDPEAKKLVMLLAEKIGLRPLDAGPLKVSSTLEQLTSLLIGMNIRYKQRSVGVNFTDI